MEKRIEKVEFSVYDTCYVTVIYNVGDVDRVASSSSGCGQGTGCELSFYEDTKLVFKAKALKSLILVMLSFCRASCIKTAQKTTLYEDTAQIRASL